MQGLPVEQISRLKRNTTELLTPPPEPREPSIRESNTPKSEKEVTASGGDESRIVIVTPEIAVGVTSHQDAVVDGVVPEKASSTTQGILAQHAQGGDSVVPVLRRNSSEVTRSYQEQLLQRRSSREGIRNAGKSLSPASTVVLSPVIPEQSHNRASLELSVNVSERYRTDTAEVALNQRRVSQDVPGSGRLRNLTIEIGKDQVVSCGQRSAGRPVSVRALTTPASIRSPDSTIDTRKSRTTSRSEQKRARGPSQSPFPTTLPIPPFSLSTFLQLELASQRPSKALIYRTSTADVPYESSEAKFERLVNFITLPLYLEGVLWYGTIACVDAWLHTFTILPLRMLQSLVILAKTWSSNVVREVAYLSSFLYSGVQRVWHRRRETSASAPISRTSSEAQVDTLAGTAKSKHRRTRSVPSTLTLDDKADLLKGLLIVTTCAILLRLDASRMYHWVRGQAAIKLYVIYNLLEVCDRMLSAIGQDVLECLFSQEALGRKLDGHSKILRPFWLFVLALIYCVCHSTALFYQVVTLNVAVNSYSNALITLLMSNQFVEIKSTIFKKFEKENLFQMTCADVVERFQLWHMLMIIASRNIVETGALNFAGSSLFASAATATSPAVANITHAAPPLTAAAILPKSFTLLTSTSSWLPVLSQVLGPFVIVLGSEMAIDFLKHAYVNKFNNVKPNIYSRFLDVLAKDYYTNAFQDQNLVKRIGLPIIPLSCLMIRAGFQTYEMLLIQWDARAPTATLASIHEHYSFNRPVPTTTVGIIVRKMDNLLNQMPSTITNFFSSSTFTTILTVLLIFLVALVTKLILGMLLLAFSRARYTLMKQREVYDTSHHTADSKRSGPYGTIEIDDEKRKVIYEDDPAGYATLKKRENRDRTKREQEKEIGYSMESLDKVKRYDMVAKRIW